jgi:FdhD protein
MSNDAVAAMQTLYYCLMTEAFRPVDVTRVRGRARVAAVDRAATEEPLEIRLHGRAFAVIMRTPGADRELAAGFLLAERVLRSADDLGAIEYCTDPGPAKAGPYQDGPAKAGRHKRSHNIPGDDIRDDKPVENIVNVTLANRSADEVDRLLADRRHVTTNSSCGLCGRLTIESLRSDVPALECAWTIDHATLASLPDRLRAAQGVFDETGGLHAAGLFTPDGTLDASAEDVGRHNAVDKVIGRMLMQERLPLSRHLLFVSGRASFEIVQKALLAGIPIVASVSAPSTLAIDLARESGVTLAGFVRGDRFNIYAHAGRIII